MRRRRQKNPHRGRPIALPGAWGELAKAAGTVAALAERLGVSPMTVWRWAHGASLTGPARLAVTTVARALRVPNPITTEGT